MSTLTRPQCTKQSLLCQTVGKAGKCAQDVVVGRPRDGDDRVAWLLDHGHFMAALDVLEADRGLRPATHQQAPL